ncbi:FAD-dependent oxidoreductase [Desulfosporosinus fructosivorans]|uniref:FAD-dependent oxidoreductase n=1 Tax=Desulfosporosinus fructosivorans TaxID=2018669 RepID=A0A4Z0R837_9FIRM|nr:FAD-binding protein [Desulfosporosinus fructosivorans]TGE39331.1 FAD-dependent oxidoreductase [Desulfosporosinus fructosivorans]
MADQNISFDVEYDLVVIGGGGSGKSAALTAAQGGLHVGLLEKMAETGGTSIYAEGTAAFESSEQKARKVPEHEGKHFPTKEEGFRRYTDYSHHRANPDVVRMQVENTAETIDIMKSMGIVYTDVTIYAYDQPLELYTFHRPDGLGAHVQEVLLRNCINAGVDIFTSTPAKKILMSDGAIVGVQALDSDGNTMNIGCKAVILASGGFGNNPDMVEKYSWLHRSAHYTYQSVPTANTGDGLNMALEVGADTESLGAIMIIPCARSKTLTSHASGAGSQPVLWVNKTGRRFASEEVAMSFADAGSTIAKQPEGVVYAIIDTDTVNHLMENGSDIGLGDFIEFHQKLTLLQAELDQDVAEGIAWKGDTIEALGKDLGFDPTMFATMVAEYNDACDKGHDPLFYKPAKFLRSVRKGPFYAINMAPSVLVSDGGIRVNGDLQVTNKDYQPIPGLYAVGNEASGLYGDTYNLDVPGTANGFAHASGRVAARHVIKTLKG